MTAPPLLGSRIKIERAKRHLSELATEFAAFAETKPYMLLPEEDPKTGGHNFRLKFRQQIPVAWGGIFGDMIHNLRSAYDLLACDLVRAKGRDNLIEVTQFPVSRSPQIFENNGRQRIEGASPKAKELIRALQPYEKGNHALGSIHELDIHDKHRLIAPVSALLGDHGGGMSVEDHRFSGFSLEPPIMIFMSSDTMRHVEDGTIIFWVRPLIPEPYRIDSDITVNIALGEGDILKGEPVIPTLNRFIDFTEQTVSLFETEIFGST